MLAILAQRDLVLIAFGQYRIRDRPLYPDIRIIPDDSAFIRGFVEAGLFILDFTNFGQSCEAVSKTNRNEQLRFVPGRQLDCECLTEGSGIDAQVQSNIEYSANGAPHEFSQRRPHILVMESA